MAGSAFGSSPPIAAKASAPISTSPTKSATIGTISAMNRAVESDASRARA